MKNKIEEKFKAFLKGLEFEYIDEFIDKLSVDDFEGLGIGMANLLKENNK